VDVGAGGFGDLEGIVGALGVEDVDVVGPGDAGEAIGEIALLVKGEDEDGDHLLVMVSRGDRSFLRLRTSEAEGTGWDWSSFRIGVEENKSTTKTKYRGSSPSTALRVRMTTSIPTGNKL
jgi:hypothetical protein